MSSMLMHAVRPRQGLDLVVLALAFVVGAVGTALLKLWGFPVLLTAAYPVGVLLAYVLFCFFTSMAALEPDTVGDNCYYLGFLFTLTSLAVTLFQIRDLTSQEGPMLAADVIPQVISGFGVALSSTIVGVALRVALMQMRPDIVARDREARRDLSAAVREFHTTLGQASRRMKEFAIENFQYAAERNSKIDDITERHGTQINELVSKQVGAFDALVHSAALGVDRQAAQMKELTDRLAAHVHELSSKQAQDFAALVHSAALGVDRQTVQMSELLTRQNQTFETAIHATASKISDALTAKLGDETLRAAEKLSDAAGQLASMIGRVAQAQEDGMPRLREAQKGVETALEKWRDSIAVQQLASGRASMALTDQTVAMAEATQAHRRAFDDASKVLGQEVASVVSTVEAHRQVTRRSNEELSVQSVELISSAEAQHTATREAMRKISEQTDSLATAAKMVIEVVEGAALRIENAAKTRAEADLAAAEHVERAETDRSREIAKPTLASRWMLGGRRSGGNA